MAHILPAGSTHGRIRSHPQRSATVSHHGITAMGIWHGEYGLVDVGSVAISKTVGAQLWPKVYSTRVTTVQGRGVKAPSTTMCSTLCVMLLPAAQQHKRKAPNAAQNLIVATKTNANTRPLGNVNQRHVLSAAVQDTSAVWTARFLSLQSYSTLKRQGIYIHRRGHDCGAGAAAAPASALTSLHGRTARLCTSTHSAGAGKIPCSARSHILWHGAEI